MSISLVGFLLFLKFMQQAFLQLGFLFLQLPRGQCLLSLILILRTLQLILAKCLSNKETFVSHCFNLLNLLQVIRICAWDKKESQF